MILDLFTFAQEEDAGQNQGKARFLASVAEARQIPTLLEE
jgi:hypothetical protein